MCSVINKGRNHNSNNKSLRNYLNKFQNEAEWIHVTFAYRKIARHLEIYKSLSISISNQSLYKIIIYYLLYYFSQNINQLIN